MCTFGATGLSSSKNAGPLAQSTATTEYKCVKWLLNVIQSNVRIGPKRWCCSVATVLQVYTLVWVWGPVLVDRQEESVAVTINIVWLFSIFSKLYCTFFNRTLPPTMYTFVPVGTFCYLKKEKKVPVLIFIFSPVQVDPGTCTSRILLTIVH